MTAPTETIRVIASEAKQSRLIADQILDSAISTSSFLCEISLTEGSVAARRIPAGCRAKLSVSNPSHPNRGKRSAEIRGRGTPHPLACLAAGLSRQRTGLPAHNADRRASRRSTAAFSLVLETAFWKRTGAAIRNALDPAGFRPAFIRSTSPLPDGPT
jgi:hypothetical protein